MFIVKKVLEIKVWESITVAALPKSWVLAARKKIVGSNPIRGTNERQRFSLLWFSVLRWADTPPKDFTKCPTDL
jgi:hypothetical protein